MSDLLVVGASLLLLVLWVVLLSWDARLHKKWLEEESDNWVNAKDMIDFITSDERAYRHKFCGNVRRWLQDRYN